MYIATALVGEAGPSMQDQQTIKLLSDISDKKPLLHIQSSSSPGRSTEAEDRVFLLFDFRLRFR